MIMKQSNYSKIFKALSNEQRLKIFMMIYDKCCQSQDSKGISEFKVEKEGGCCPVFRSLAKTFTKVCGCMNLSRSTVSHHMKELQNAGLIILEREGQTFRCWINRDTIEDIKNFFE